MRVSPPLLFLTSLHPSCRAPHCLHSWAYRHPRRLANLYVNVWVLRKVLGCSLPIQVVYQGLREMDAWMFGIIREELQGVELLDGSRVPYPDHHRKVKP